MSRHDTPRKDAPPAHDVPPPDYFANSKVWNREDVAKWLGVSKETVDCEMEYGGLPYIRMSSSPNKQGRTVLCSEYRVKLWFWERQES